MKVTIDKLHIKSHERYAKDQANLDLKLISESSAIPQHSEITGTSAIYSSKLEELFELQIRNIPWAIFSPPPKYTIQSRRFFSYRLLPKISCQDDDEDESEEEKEERENSEKGAKSLNLIKEILEAKKKEAEAAHTFAKDKAKLLNLLESIKRLDKLLSFINSKKLQYQKG